MAQMSLRRPTQWMVALSCRRHSCRDPPERGNHMGFFVGGSLPPCGAAGERSELNIKPPFGTPLLMYRRCYFLKSFPQVDTSAKQRRLEIRVFPLLGELPTAIQSHLHDCQLTFLRHLTLFILRRPILLPFLFQGINFASFVSPYLYDPNEGSLLSKYIYCTTSCDFELY